MYKVLSLVLLLLLVGCTGTIDVNLPMHLQVSNYTGINADTDALYFGTVDVARTATVQRIVVVTNQGEAQGEYVTKFSGELSDYARAEPSKFSLHAKESINITVYVSPSGLDVGNYTGNMVIYRK